MLKKEQVEDLEQIALVKAKRALSNNRLSTAEQLITLLLGLKNLQEPGQGGSESTHVIGFVQPVKDDGAEGDDWEGKKKKK
jgi:hypothetical protein